MADIMFVIFILVVEEYIIAAMSNEIQSFTLNGAGSQPFPPIPNLRGVTSLDFNFEAKMIYFNQYTKNQISQYNMQTKEVSVLLENPKNRTSK